MIIVIWNGHKISSSVHPILQEVTFIFGWSYIISWHKRNIDHPWRLLTSWSVFLLSMMTCILTFIHQFYVIFLLLFEWVFFIFILNKRFLGCLFLDEPSFDPALGVAILSFFHLPPASFLRCDNSTSRSSFPDMSFPFYP